MLSSDMSLRPKKAAFSLPGSAYSDGKKVRKPRVILELFVLCLFFYHMSLYCVNYKQTKVLMELNNSGNSDGRIVSGRQSCAFTVTSRATFFIFYFHRMRNKWGGIELF